MLVNDNNIAIDFNMTSIRRRGPRLAAPWDLVAPRVEVPGDKMKTQKC